MKRISRSIVFAIALAVSMSSVALTAQAGSHPRSIKVHGTVLNVNRQARTMLVEDLWSHKLYQVQVPEGVTFKITFGLNADRESAELSQTNPNDRVLFRARRTQDERLALSGNRSAEVLVAAR
jgi:hypothetical protein